MFRDRRDAGRRLAAHLTPFAREHPIVIGLPRGGVPVAAEVARAMGADLDILAVRKLGAPGQPELAVGAVAEDGTAIVDPRTAAATGMGQAELDRTLTAETAELRRRIAAYRADRPPLAVAGRTAIVVDDGMATGLTDLAAARALRARGAARIVVAVPVASPEAVDRLEREADAVVAVTVPERLRSVGEWYRDFHPVRDDEVLAALGHDAAPPSDEEPERLTVGLDTSSGRIAGDLTLPAAPTGLVVFAHGSGSSRHSPRNRAVAETLNRRGLATLLADLLTDAESATPGARFDIALLAGRLEQLTRGLLEQPGLKRLPVGLFGASTGAAAALSAAAAMPERIGAVVSRGGRPDLAGDRLTRVRAPTLLIVGGDDEVLALNRRAARLLHCPHELSVIPGAGHLFEEPGTLEAVAELAGDWFERHLVHRPAGASPLPVREM